MAKYLAIRCNLYIGPYEDPDSYDAWWEAQAYLEDRDLPAEILDAYFVGWEAEDDDD